MNTQPNIKKDIILMSDIDNTLLDTPQEKAWFLGVKEKGLVNGMDAPSFSHFYADYLGGQSAELGSIAAVTHLKGHDGLTYAERFMAENGINYGSIDQKFIEENISKEALSLRQVKDKFYKEMIKNEEIGVFKDVENLLIAGKCWNYLIAAVSASRSAEELLKRTYVIPKVPNSEGVTFYDMFDIHSLNHVDATTGKTYAKKDLFKNAYETAIQNFNFEGKNQKVIVFEDAPSGVAAALDNSFYPVAICRKSKYGALLSDKSDMEKVGAKVVLYEDELAKMYLPDVINSIKANYKL